MLLFFECYVDHRDLHVLTHSFPTRRSSDLPRWSAIICGCCARRASYVPSGVAATSSMRRPTSISAVFSTTWWRSEEHTSELQSLMRNSYAVFCLKKKKDITASKELQTT